MHPTNSQPQQHNSVDGMPTTTPKAAVLCDAINSNNLSQQSSVWEPTTRMQRHASKTPSCEASTRETR